LTLYLPGPQRSCAGDGRHGRWLNRWRNAVARGGSAVSWVEHLVLLLDLVAHIWINPIRRSNKYIFFNQKILFVKLLHPSLSPSSNLYLIQRSAWNSRIKSRVIRIQFMHDAHTKLLTCTLTYYAMLVRTCCCGFAEE